MKTTKLKRALFGALTVAAICATLFLRQWKLKSDRAACLINMRNMYSAIYSRAGMDGIGPGQPIPGGVRKSIERMGLTPLPVCPSGGTYSFVNETTYTIEGVNENVRCTHAGDLGHVWQNE
jgi:hypothetical protein